MGVLVSNSRAEISIDESFSYYDISGNSISGLRAAIYANSKIDNATRGFDASTNWTISWQFDYRQESLDCRIIAANVIATIEYRLPRWLTLSNSNDRSLIARWRTYIDNLTKHELIHGEFTRDAASNIENTLLTLNTAHSAMSCDDLNAKANASAENLIRELRQQHEKFDLDTDHGKKAGAVLP